MAQSEDVIALDQSSLENSSSRLAGRESCGLRFFGGLQEEEIAEVLGVSLITVKRDWKVARAWLVGRLQAPLKDCVSRYRKLNPPFRRSLH